MVAMPRAFHQQLDSGRILTVMLKGTRDGILKRVQPVSIHGQVSLDVFFTDVDDPEGQTHAARIGPEAVIGNLEPGDRIKVEYLVGVAVRIERVPSA